MRHRAALRLQITLIRGEKIAALTRLRLRQGLQSITQLVQNLMGVNDHAFVSRDPPDVVIRETATHEESENRENKSDRCALTD